MRRSLKRRLSAAISAVLIIAVPLDQFLAAQQLSRSVVRGAPALPRAGTVPLGALLPRRAFPEPLASFNPGLLPAPPASGLAQSALAAQALPAAHPAAAALVEAPMNPPEAIAEPALRASFAAHADARNLKILEAQNPSLRALNQGSRVDLNLGLSAQSALYDRGPLARRPDADGVFAALGRGFAPALRARAASDAADSGAAPVGLPIQGSEPLPAAYRWYLGALFLSSGINQAIMTIITPLYSNELWSEGFTIWAQAIGLAAIIPGSLLGAWLIETLGSKQAYILSYLAIGLLLLSVPLSVWFLGSVAPWHFLFVPAANGAIYGALRGVAERDMKVRVLGQDSKGLLQRVAALYYVVVSPAYIVTSALATNTLMPLFGKDWVSLIGAVFALASLLPFALIRYAHKASSAAAAPHSDQTIGAQTELPLSLYLPFVLSWVVHMGFYYLLGPFFSIVVFHNEALLGTMISAYAIGNLVAAVSLAILPVLLNALRSQGNWPPRLLPLLRIARWIQRISERAWAIFLIASTLGFLGAALLAQSPWLSVAMTELIGVGVTAVHSKWPAIYQQELSMDAQPRVFRWLSIAYVPPILAGFLLMKGGMNFTGLSLHGLLVLISIALALFALWTLAALFSRPVSSILARRR